MSAVESTVGLTVGLITIAGAVLTWLRWIRPKVKKGQAEAVAVRDAILGRDAVRDSITGRVLAPPLPGIGQRIDTVERAVATLADQHRVLEDHERRIKANEARISKLEDAAAERIVTKQESALAWRAMEAATNATPPEPDET